MADQTNDVRVPGQTDFVRCNSCRAPISGVISRCPYCGQLTTGTERAISQFDLDSQRRERRRNQCKMCGKTVAANTPLCSDCEASDRRKTRLLFLLLGTAIIAIIWFFS